MKWKEFLAQFFAGKEHKFKDNTVQARAIERLRRQGHITQREIIMLGTNHASKMITRLRRMGFISRKHGEAKNASGVGIHFVYLWTGK